MTALKVRPLRAGAFFSLPLAGREGRSNAKARVGVFKNNCCEGRLSTKRPPPPDRCFATATLPALASLAGEG